MRKLIAACFALLLVTAFVGCSDDADEGATDEAAEVAEDAATDDTADASGDDASDDEGSDDEGSDDEGSGDEDVEVVNAPDDLVDDLKGLAQQENEEVTDEEAACLADMMVIVLGEDAARDAVDGGTDAVESAMDEASDRYTEEESLELLGQLSDECQSIFEIDPTAVAEPVVPPAPVTSAP